MANLLKALTNHSNVRHAGSYVRQQWRFNLTTSGYVSAAWLKDLNEALRNYYSPIYEQGILLQQKGKKCMRAVINRDHPLYNTWLSIETRNLKIKTESCLTYAGGEGWTQGKIKNIKKKNILTKRN
jgi:hypothetical protein